MSLSARMQQAVVAAVVATLSTGLSAVQAQERPSIVVAVQAVPDSLTPCGPTRNITYRTLYNVFDFLIGTDFTDNYSLRPSLATDWRRVDDRTMELTLREGVIFHDGTEMTAEDVAFSLGDARMMDEEAPCHGVSRQFVGTIDRVEATGPYTLRVTTSAPDPILDLRLGGWMTQVVSQEAFEAANSFEDFAFQPVGTGPYRVVDFAPGQYIDMEAHDDYWGGRPPFAQLRFEAVPETAARIAGLVAGDYDLITEIAPDQFGTIEGYDDLEVIGGIVGNHRMLAYSVQHPVLADVRVRQAIGLAIDREAIVEGLWAGRVIIPNGFQFSFYGETYVDDYPAMAYDPEEARRLLQEAGYNGEMIEFLIVPGYYTADVATTEAMVDMWRDVGLNVDVTLVDSWGDILDGEAPQHFNNTSCTMVVPDALGQIWRCFNPTSITRRLGYWSNEEFDQLGRVLETSLDPEERQATLRRMMDIFLQEDPGGTVLHAMGMFYGKRRDIPFEAYPTPYMDFGPFNPAVRETAAN